MMIPFVAFNPNIVSTYKKSIIFDFFLISRPPGLSIGVYEELYYHRCYPKIEGHDLTKTYWLNKKKRI